MPRQTNSERIEQLEKGMVYHTKIISAMCDLLIGDFKNRITQDQREKIKPLEKVLNEANR